jgi:hypothetical protein
LPSRSDSKVLSHARAAVDNRVRSAWLQVERRPDIDVRLQGIVEVVWHHTDDTMRNAVDCQQPAGSVGPAIQVLAPDPFADDRDVSVGTLVGAIKRLPEDRMRAEHAKVVRADGHRPDTLGLAARREIGPLDAVRKCDGDVERPAVIPVVDGCRAGQVANVAADAVIHANEPLRLLVRQRLQNDGIQDTEHGCVGSRAKRQRSDDDRDEARGADEGTNGVLEVEKHATHV